jgi:hypothetical protein
MLLRQGGTWRGHVRSGQVRSYRYIGTPRSTSDRFRADSSHASLPFNTTSNLQGGFISQFTPQQHDFQTTSDRPRARSAQIPAPLRTRFSFAIHATPYVPGQMNAMPKTLACMPTCIRHPIPSLHCIKSQHPPTCHGHAWLHASHLHLLLSLISNLRIISFVKRQI